MSVCSLGMVNAIQLSLLPQPVWTGLGMIKAKTMLY